MSCRSAACRSSVSRSSCTPRAAPVLLALVEQGLGVSIFSQKLAELRGSLERVLPELPPIDIPVWLVTHRELRTSRRIRCVWDLLAEELGKL
ncbi:MAG: LysR substrate-binding domain-containing protein [Acidobacteriota bacterium]